MGAIRSTAQLLSYELVFSSIILILILFSGSFSLTYIVECQQAVWNIVPLLPICLMFFIAILAETNRPPFDLSELGHLIYFLIFFKSLFKVISVSMLSKDHYMLEIYIKWVKFFLFDNQQETKYSYKNKVGSSETLRDLIPSQLPLHAGMVLMIKSFFSLFKSKKRIKTFLINFWISHKLNYFIDDSHKIFISNNVIHRSEFKFKKSKKPIYPQKIYKNIFKLEIQKEIEIQLKNKRGIYGFFCVIENKLYISSSENLFKRFKEHIKGKK